MPSVSAGNIILTPTQPVGSGQPQRESNSGPPHQESRALPTELPPPPPFFFSQPVSQSKYFLPSQRVIPRNALKQKTPCSVPNARYPNKSKLIQFFFLFKAISQSASSSQSMQLKVEFPTRLSIAKPSGNILPNVKVEAKAGIRFSETIQEIKERKLLHRIDLRMSKKEVKFYMETEKNQRLPDRKNQRERKRARGCERDK